MDSVLLVGSVPKPCSSRPLLQFPSHAKFSAVTKGSLIRSQVLNSTAWNSPEKYQLGRLRGPLVNQYVKGDGQKLSLYGRVDHKGLMNATSEQHFESEPESHNPNSPWKSIQTGVDVFYRFSRPHTVIGTALSILSVSLLAVQGLSDFTPLFFTGLTEVNKPYLPLASEEYSVGTGIMIVASCALTSFGLGWVVGSWPLFWALFVSFVLGTAYSISTH